MSPVWSVGIDMASEVGMWPRDGALMSFAQLRLSARLISPIALPADTFIFAGIDFEVVDLQNPPGPRLVLPTYLFQPDQIPWPALGEGTIVVATAFQASQMARMDAAALLAAMNEWWRGSCSCEHCVRRRAESLEGHVTQEHVETLIELAKDDNEQMFYETALCLGVTKDRLPGLWKGTRKRVGKKDPEPPPDDVVALLQPRGQA